KWMTATGNRFLRNHSGSWAHLSARELANLRKHYVEILGKLWPTLATWPQIFSLKAGRFSNTHQQTIRVSPNPPEFKFLAAQKGDLVTLSLTLFLDGQEAPLNIRSG